MKVELLMPVLEGRTLKVAMRHGRDPIPFVKGAVIEMSEESGRKYIEAGLAKAVDAASPPKVEEPKRGRKKTAPADS